MPVEIAVPFRLDADNRIATESDPNAQIRQHVMSLINTEPGERAVIAGYGVPLSDQLFEEGDEAVALEIGDMIKAAFATWEPGVALRRVEAVPGTPGDGLAQVAVDYLRTDAPDTASAGRSSNVAVIRVGGHVTEVVRG